MKLMEISKRWDYAWKTADMIKYLNLILTLLIYYNITKDISSLFVAVGVVFLCVTDMAVAFKEVK